MARVGSTRATLFAAILGTAALVMAALVMAGTIPGASAQSATGQAWSRAIGDWQADCAATSCTMTVSGRGVTGDTFIVETDGQDDRLWLILDQPPVNPGQSVHYRCDDGPEGAMGAGTQLELDRLDRTRLEVVNAYLVEGLQVLFRTCHTVMLRYQPASAAGRDDADTWIDLAVPMGGFTALRSEVILHLTGETQ